MITTTGGIKILDESFAKRVFPPLRTLKVNSSSRPSTVRMSSRTMSDAFAFCEAKSLGKFSHLSPKTSNCQYEPYLIKLLLELYLLTKRG